MLLKRTTCAMCASFIVGALAMIVPHTATAASFQAEIEPFLARYCYSCHGAEKQKADRRFDTLDANLADVDVAQHWQDIVDQLNLGDMPPKGARQPKPDEVRPIVERISRELLAAHARREGTTGRITLRRLNRVQYDRTVRDLLALDGMLFDPTENFPPDEPLGQFDNIGATLVTSDFLLQQYVNVAHQLVARAVSYGPRPETRKYHFDAPFSPTLDRPDSQDVPGSYQHIRKSTADQGGHLWIEKFVAGAPHAGYYKLRFKAEALHRNYSYAESLVGVNKSEPLRVGIVAGAAAYGPLENRTGSDRALDEFELADDKPQWYEATVWLDKGFQPRLTFPNGPRSVRSIRRRLVAAEPHAFPEFSKLVEADTVNEKAWNEAKAAGREPSTPPGQEGAKAKAQKAFRRTQNTSQGWATFYREYQGPRVRVYEIELEGPFYEQWPTKSHRALYGDDAPTYENAANILRRFATRAFRRPVGEAELRVLLHLVDERRKGGGSPQQAIEAGLKAVLCSPDFLYLVEPEGPLDNYALASRLSYFLWSSPPDETLLKSASEGRLNDPTELAAQARRMLADDKAKVFATQFISRWLQLYKIGSMPPDPARFPAYYVDGLEKAMKEETRLFFQHVLGENLPITTFVDADFTFVNGGLARLYGIDGVRGGDFQKVSLADPRRGGLFGQASVLTASANGIDTSPVIRGIWVLENILGTPPAPPPPDVEPLEPDIRGATTIRDQLEKHRKVDSCAQCHRKIDPLGFALENFDPIGAWRDRYPQGRDRGPAIDASGQLPDGSKFADIAGLKKILSGRKRQFAHCLTEKMLTYALGRKLDVADRQQVDGIVTELDHRGDGLRDLILLIVTSDAFRKK
jgi:hypothetical protein